MMGAGNVTTVETSPPPGALILDGESAVTLAVCGHWWQTRPATVGLALRERRPVLWAPIGTCESCLERRTLLMALDAISTLTTHADMPVDIAMAIHKLATGATLRSEPLRLGDTDARAVVVLTSWEEGDTNPRTRDLACCPLTPGCPMALGHRGPCDHGRTGGPYGPSVGVEIGPIPARDLEDGPVSPAYGLEPVPGEDVALVVGTAAAAAPAYAAETVLELVELVELDIPEVDPHVD